MARALKPVAIGLALVAALVTGCAQQGSGACVAPVIEVSPSEVAAGQEITISMRYAFATCHDQGEGPERPLDLVELVLTASGQEAERMSVSPSVAGTATVTLLLARDLPAGPATITSPTVPHATAAELTITE